jgi:hypothetical protein
MGGDLSGPIALFKLDIGSSLMVTTGKRGLNCDITAPPMHYHPADRLHNREIYNYSLQPNIMIYKNKSNMLFTQKHLKVGYESHLEI